MKFPKIQTYVSAWLLGFFLGALFVSTTAYAFGPIPISIEAPTVERTFRFDARSVNPRPHTVNLCVTFNSWSKTDTPMVDHGGVYTVTLGLEPGLYHYKFLVDGERWFADSTADKSLEDEDDHN